MVRVHYRAPLAKRVSLSFNGVNMKTSSYVVIGLIILIGGFLLVPKKKENGTVNTKTDNNPNPAANAKADPTTFEKISATKATIKTEKGDIVLELYPNDAPKTVTNFATLAKNGYYDGLTFHRVEIGIAQGGDPNGNGTGGASVYGSKFEDELNTSTASYQAGYAEGVIAMANSGPNTNGSQFFINQEDNTAKFRKDYTIFGKVVSGLDVAKRIQVGDIINTITVE